MHQLFAFGYRRWPTPTGQHHQLTVGWAWLALGWLALKARR